jgi:hypothetical protein
MSFKTFPVYDHPTYTVRQSATLYNAAASAVSLQKFTTYTQTLLFGMTMTPYTLGTSTYSSTTSAQQISLFVVYNTSTTTTYSLSTLTYGPYIPGGPTTTAQTGYPTYNVFNTASQLGSLNGLLVPAGALVYSSSGTDATANILTTIDYQIYPLAQVVA